MGDSYMRFGVNGEHKVISAEDVRLAKELDLRFRKVLICLNENVTLSQADVFLLVAGGADSLQWEEKIPTSPHNNYLYKALKEARILRELIVVAKYPERLHTTVGFSSLIKISFWHLEFTKRQVDLTGKAIQCSKSLMILGMQYTTITGGGNYCNFIQCCENLNQIWGYFQKFSLIEAFCLSKWFQKNPHVRRVSFESEVSPVYLSLAVTKDLFANLIKVESLDYLRLASGSKILDQSEKGLSLSLYLESLMKAGTRSFFLS